MGQYSLSAWYNDFCGYGAKLIVSWSLTSDGNHVTQNNHPPKSGTDWKALIQDALWHRDGNYNHQVQTLIVVVTLVSVFAAILNSVPALDAFDPVFGFSEKICAIFFMLEFGVRLWTTDDRQGYVFSFWGLVDMISFVPIIIALIPFDAAIVAQQMKILLVMRAFRIAKVTRAYIEGVRAANSGDVSQDLNVKAYFLTLFTAAIGNGAVMYALEGHQPHYGTMPRAILEVMKIFMGTAGWPTQTLGGELFIVIVRFQALCLLGLLIEVMGGFMRGLLFGINDGGSLHGGEAVKAQGAALHDDR